MLCRIPCRKVLTCIAYSVNTQYVILIIITLDVPAMNRNVTPLSQMMIGQRFDVEFFMYLNSSDI